MSNRLITLPIIVFCVGMNMPLSNAQDPQIGDELTLKASVLVATNTSAFLDLDKRLKSKDSEGLDKLVDDGTAKVLVKGTKIRLIEVTRVFGAQIRVLDGKYAKQEFYVHYVLLTAEQKSEAKTEPKPKPEPKPDQEAILKADKDRYAELQIKRAVLLAKIGPRPGDGATITKLARWQQSYDGGWNTILKELSLSDKKASELMIRGDREKWPKK